MEKYCCKYLQQDLQEEMRNEKERGVGEIWAA
jgi:hypothetical protein